MSKEKENFIERIEGMIVKMNQSNKSENSGLVGDMQRVQKEYKTCQGNMKEDISAIHAYIKQDVAWKKEVTPAIKMVQSVQGFGRVAVYLLGFVASMGVAWITITNFLKK